MTDEEQAEVTYQRYVEHIVIPRILASCETPEDLVKFDEIQSGKCEGFSGPCGKPGVLFHAHTAYHKTISNYHVHCPDCIKESDEHWDEMWKEYYSSQGVY